MAVETVETGAGTSALHPLLGGRVSTRAFDEDAVISDAVLERVLEAARWSPSAGNTQPWRIGVARRGSAEHAALVDALSGTNRTWAPRAAVLVVLAAVERGADGAQLPWARLDVGQALAHLSVQAEHEGLGVHAMGGFDPSRVREVFVLGDGVTPLVVVALGARAEITTIDPGLAARETERSRRPLAETLLHAHQRDGVAGADA